MMKGLIALTLVASVIVLGACSPPADTTTGAGSATTASSDTGGTTMSTATAASGDTNGAGKSAAVPASGATSGEVIHLDQKASGSTVSITPGQRIAITLSANPTTGYSWNVVTPPDPAVLKQVSNTFVAPSAAPMGAGGFDAWLFEGVAPGTTNFKLSYFRTFSPTEKGSDFELNVTVK
jgi:inhibitor of cysteine peptidase